MVEQLVINVGRKIRELRQQRGLSLRQLSEKVGVSPSAIQKIEHNLISPTLGTVLRIVKGLGTTLQSLLDEHVEQRDVVYDMAVAVSGAQRMVGVESVAGVAGTDQARFVLEALSHASDDWRVQQVLTEKGWGGLKDSDMSVVLHWSPFSLGISLTPLRPRVIREALPKGQSPWPRPRRSRGPVCQAPPTSS